jgi:YidC/Oxa1 family membrane protein insertase
MTIASGLMLAAGKFWILDPLYAALGLVLAWFYAVIPSYGIAIILLTATVSALRMPLVAKQVKSQQEMQRIQPELKRIQAKYKADPQKRNEELMKLYKEHNVNPFAGCLPLVLQMPLFIVLYRLILNLNHRPEPKHIPNTSALFKALQASGGKMHSFGMDLAQAASRTHGSKLFPYAVLIALVVGTGLFQQRQMTARLPKDAVNAQVQIMGKVFPVFLGFISFSIPAGVVLYFFVSNMWQIGQQAVLFRNQPIGGAPPPPKAEKADAGDKGGHGGGAGGGRDGKAQGTGGGRGGGARGGKAAASPASSAGAPGDGRDSDGSGAGAGGAGTGAGGAAGAGGGGAGGARGGGGAGGRSAKGAPKGTRGPGGAVPKGNGRPAKAAAAGAGRPAAGKKSGGSPSSGGGFFARLRGAAAASDGKSNGKPGGGGTAGGRRAASGRSGSNGRGASSRPSGRAQPKGQGNPRGRQRNTRKGK